MDGAGRGGVGGRSARSGADTAGDAQSWAGFYLGVHGGYGWGDNNFRQTLCRNRFSPFVPFNGFKSKGAVVTARTPVTTGNLAAR